MFLLKSWMTKRFQIGNIKMMKDQIIQKIKLIWKHFCTIKISSTRLSKKWIKKTMKKTLFQAINTKKAEVLLICYRLKIEPVKVMANKLNHSCQEEDLLQVLSKRFLRFQKSRDLVKNKFKINLSAKHWVTFTTSWGNRRSQG